MSGSLTEIEARLTGQTLAWVGGLALVLGAIFFLSLAFSRGWIGPELRVLIGLAAGSVALAGGAAFMERGNRLLGHVLTPVGLAVISISLVGATRLYGLVPSRSVSPSPSLSAIAAATIAVRSDSQTVAAFGLVAVLLAPPLMGAHAGHGDARCSSRSSWSARRASPSGVRGRGSRRRPSCCPPHRPPSWVYAATATGRRPRSASPCSGCSTSSRPAARRSAASATT